MVTQLFDFNPRAYVRHDLDAATVAGKAGFQSTCLREARPVVPTMRNRILNFNPRAYVRHDGRILTPGRENNFNPRAYVRHDLVRGRGPRDSTYFNPRAYVRHDPRRRSGRSDSQHFNPRAYVRHDIDH